METKQLDLFLSQKTPAPKSVEKFLLETLGLTENQIVSIVENQKRTGHYKVSCKYKLEFIRKQRAYFDEADYEFDEVQEVERVFEFKFIGKELHFRSAQISQNAWLDTSEPKVIQFIKNKWLNKVTLADLKLQKPKLFITKSAN